MHSGKLVNHAWLEITQRCNLECIHCYTNSSPTRRDADALDPKRVKQLIRELRDIGCGSIQLIGGEPTSNPDFTEYLNYTLAQDFEVVSVYSNLYSIRSDQFAAMASPRVSISTSIYSSLPEAHDTIVKKPGAFKKSIDNLIRFIQCGRNVSVGIVHIPGRNDDIDTTRRFLREIGVTDISVDVMRSVGRAAQGHTKLTWDHDGLCGQCASGTICITYNGELFPCIMSRHLSVGNVRTSKLSTPDLIEKLIMARRQLAEAFSTPSDGSLGVCVPRTGPEGPICGPGSHPQVRAMLNVGP